MESTLLLQQNNKPSRFAFIDGLRGIAVVAVTLFHFYRGSPFYELLSQVVPKPLDILLTHGWLGVEVFFVISGFVIAHSLRKAEINAISACNFILCRYLRLAPPYFIAIILIIGVNYFSNLALKDRAAPLFGWQALVAHLFYLQEYLQIDQISPVFWTLCVEVYFYLSFIFLIYLMQYYLNLRAINSYLAIILSLSLLSIASLFSMTDSKNSILANWYIFAAGILVYWVFFHRASLYWLWSYFFVLVTLTLIQPENLRAPATLIVSLLIWQACQSGNLSTWLSCRWIQYLGKISYSLYLLHTIIGSRVINLGYRVHPNHPLLATFWIALAFALSVIAAHILYVMVEKPSIRLSKLSRLSA